MLQDLTSEEFNIAVRRLQVGEVDEESNVEVSQSVALLRASYVCSWTQHALRTLSDYQLDLNYKVQGEPQNQLLRSMMNEREVQKKTLVRCMHSSGRLVNDLLQWFKPHRPWAIIILLIVFIGELQRQ